MNLPLCLLAASLAFAAAPLPAPSNDLKGTVLETIDAGTYTYLRLKTASGEKWAAVPQTKLKKGAKTSVVGSMNMVDFESPTLKRKFPRIAFGTLEDSGAPKAPVGDPHAGGMPPAMAAGMGHGERAPDTGPIKVDKATGPDGRTVAEVYAQKKALKGKEVVVRGKVVKMNANILDRNWAHLRDGSGKAKDGNDDITVMLKDTADVGQVVTVRGKVVLDKDLGGMYKFAVVLEDAVLVK